MNLLVEPYRVFNRIIVVLQRALSLNSNFHFLKSTINDEYPISLKVWFNQKIKGVNGSAYWPVHPTSLIKFQSKVIIGKHSYPGYQPGCFINGSNGIIIGDYSYFAPNVGIMSSNHNVYDLRELEVSSPIKIGNYCWVGMNSVILPEVSLGDFTIVGAGSVVTKSFSEGYCVIAGNPAKIIRYLDSEKCIRYEKETKTIGYLTFEEFAILKENIERNIWNT
jgi:acetyltransferase-like isoleucine patch superfamily enzyme